MLFSFSWIASQGDWYRSIVRCHNLIDGEWLYTSGPVLQFHTIIGSNKKHTWLPTLTDAYEYLQREQSKYS